MDNATGNNDSGYPPYDIEKIDEDDYRITMALSGFNENDLNIMVNDGVLIITANSPEEDEERHFLHRGIAKRAFERRFKLDDTIRIPGASFENGLLVIDLQREVPEHLKPRQIKIQSVRPAKLQEIKQDAEPEDRTAIANTPCLI